MLIGVVAQKCFPKIKKYHTWVDHIWFILLQTEITAFCDEIITELARVPIITGYYVGLWFEAPCPAFVCHMPQL